MAGVYMDACAEEEIEFDRNARIKFCPSNARIQKFFRVPIGFKEQTLERAYLLQLNSKMQVTIQRVGFIGLCVLQPLTIIYLVTIFRFEKPTTLDIIHMSLWALATLVGLCRRWVARLGELAVLILSQFFFALALANHPVRHVHLFGIASVPPPHDHGVSDSLPLILASIISVATFRLNVRSATVAPVILTAPMIYLSFTLPLPHFFEPSLIHRLTLAGGIAVLYAILFIEHCNAEVLDREEFLRLQQVRSCLVKEKVLRFQAEHLSERLASVASSSEDDGVSVPESSLPRSNLSSALFHPNLGDEQHLQLRALIKTGVSEQWLISPLQVTCDFTQILGKGAFGHVFRGLCSSVPVAIKVATAHLGENGLGSVASELRILRQIRHPNIVSFYGACILPHAGEMLLVEEEINGDKLSKLISLGVPGKQQCLSMLLGVCSGLSYLHTHRRPIVHSDVKPANIMVESPLGTTRILDFGLSRYDQSKPRGKTGTLRWQAPETLKTHVPDTANDIYSFGFVAFYITTGNLPYTDKSWAEIMELRTGCLVEGADLPVSWPEPPTAMQAQCQSLCVDCLKINPRERPTARALLVRLSTWFHPDEEDAEVSAEQELVKGLISFMKPRRQIAAL